MRHFLNQFIKERSGQSLIEIMIGLAIGAILIGTASFGVAFILRSSSTNQNLSVASEAAQGLLEKVRSFSNAGWQNVYGLQKSSSTQYFLVASGTSLFAVSGKEGILDNDVTNGLVGEWGFDESVSSTSTVTYDLSGNGNNGTLYGSPTRASSSCKMANCMSFNGLSQYVSIGSTGTYDLTSVGTVMVWVKIPSAWSGSNYPNMVGKGANAGWDTEGWGLFAFNPVSDNRIGVGFRNGASTKVVSFSNALKDQWIHIAGTWNGSSIIVYENGAQKASSTQTISPPSTSYPVTIGKDNGVQYFDGEIDDVRIYNRALSADEILQLYRSGIFGRYFYIENACRSNDASSTVTGVSPCGSGSVDDPLTQKATAVTEWTSNGKTAQFSLAGYLTRWKNFLLRQTDWSGGSGQTGVFTTPDNTYASGTNVVTTPLGSFQIQNLSQE